MEEFIQRKRNPGHEFAIHELWCSLVYVFQICASLLLFMEEEDAFWMMGAIIEDLLPASYYSSTLIGVQVSAMKTPADVTKPVHHDTCSKCVLLLRTSACQSIAECRWCEFETVFETCWWGATDLAVSLGLQKLRFMCIHLIVELPSSAWQMLKKIMLRQKIKRLSVFVSGWPASSASVDCDVSSRSGQHFERTRYRWALPLCFGMWSYEPTTIYKSAFSFPMDMSLQKKKKKRKRNPAWSWKSF